MSRSPHQLHEALAALRGDDPQVRLAAVDHLRAGRRRRLGQAGFPQAGAVGHGEESRRGASADVAISCGDRQRGRSQAVVLRPQLYFEKLGKI